MVDLSKLWSIREIMPVITVDNSTGEVIMHGYMNKEAFAYTLKTHRVWYYSLENGTVEKFGNLRGNTQKLMSVKTDYEYKCLLISVEQKGHALHYNGEHKTFFINDIYNRDDSNVHKHRKFGKVDVDENFDYSKEDYDDYDE